MLRSLILVFSFNYHMKNIRKKLHIFLLANYKVTRLLLCHTWLLLLCSTAQFPYIAFLLEDEIKQNSCRRVWRSPEWTHTTDMGTATSRTHRASAPTQKQRLPRVRLRRTAKPSLSSYVDDNCVCRKCGPKPSPHGYLLLEDCSLTETAPTEISQTRMIDSSVYTKSVFLFICM